METEPEALKWEGPELAAEQYDRRALELKAQSLIDNRDKIEHDGWALEPDFNARTALFEALTAKGHLSRIEFTEPPDLINKRTLKRLVNGWSDNLPAWEQERRFLEIVEELTIHEVWRDVQAGNLPPDTMVVTISNYPEMVLDEQQAELIGYRSLNKKGMVRTTAFDGGVRTVEQVSRSASDDGSAERFYGARGFVVGSGSARILANQMIVSRTDFPDGVVDIQRALDAMAGSKVLYGENQELTDFDLPGYHVLRQVSAAREGQAEHFINELAAFERELNINYQTGRISYKEKLSAFNARRRELVTKICVLDPSYSYDARGKAAVEHFEKAALAMAAGDDDAGGQHLGRAMAVADSRAEIVCGGDGLSLANHSVTTSEASRLYREAKQDRKNWQWKKGVCNVKECPSRPAKTEVGPCSVCRNCQKIFDSKDSPKRVYKTRGFFELLFESKAA